MELISKLKNELGWTIGRLDRGVPKKQLDAYVTACVCHSCPRCNKNLDDYLIEFIPSLREERERQRQIQEHPILSKYPSRNDAEFTKGNDHNPLILEKCSRCSGNGQDQELPTCEKIKNCPDCDGLGFTGKLIKFFSNDEPIQSIVKNNAGWVKCPFCKRSFKTYDNNAWTGLRHKYCGQKLNILDSIN